jgi:hypothetical protein
VTEAKKTKGQFSVQKYIVPFGAGALLSILFSVAFYQLYQSIATITSDLIVEQVSELAEIFNRIDKTAGIYSFEHEKNYIDFLTVKNFVGSEVGSLNLRVAAGWEGPYLHDNPTIHEKYYVVINSNQGYYITPDDGIKLFNGKVLGKDIILNKETDFEQLVNDPEGLLYKNQPLARKIK